MLTIGLTTWSEHAQLVTPPHELTLNEYAQYFPTVEVDSFYYGLREPTVAQKWLTQVPAQFQFIIKVHQGISQQRDFSEFTGTEKELFERFRQSIAPLQATGQLKTLLCQFPPAFHLNQESVGYLARMRAYWPTLPLAVEFRHASWYEPQYFAQLQQYLRRLKITLVIADEAQTANNSVPFRPVVTTPHLAFLRLHGRNQQGWQHPGEQWRKTRTLYHYSTSELNDLKKTVEQLQQEAQEVCVIFNNNAGGDAAGNAQELQRLMGLKFAHLAPTDPQQMDLF